MAAAEEWSEADIFEGEAQAEQADGDAAPLATEGLTLRTPSLRSLHSEATAASSPSAPAPRHHAEEAKAGKKRTFAEELVFALSDDEESDEGPGEPEPKMRLRGQEPPQRLQAWYQAREDFQPPHCLAAQSCPGNAAGGALPSLAGSVYEGRGRKLTGTSAMRLRTTVLRQTGFLGPSEEGSKAP